MGFNTKAYDLFLLLELDGGPKKGFDTKAYDLSFWSVLRKSMRLPKGKA